MDLGLKRNIRDYGEDRNHLSDLSLYEIIHLYLTPEVWIPLAGLIVFMIALARYRVAMAKLKLEQAKKEGRREERRRKAEVEQRRLNAKKED